MNFIFTFYLIFFFQVSPNSPAHRHIDAGDAIVQINGYETNDMTHMQAQQLIKNSGHSLQLTVKK